MNGRLFWNAALAASALAAIVGGRWPGVAVSAQSRSRTVAGPPIAGSRLVAWIGDKSAEGWVARGGILCSDWVNGRMCHWFLDTARGKLTAAPGLDRLSAGRPGIAGAPCEISPSGGYALWLCGEDRVETAAMDGTGHSIVRAKHDFVFWLPTGDAWMSFSGGPRRPQSGIVHSANGRRARGIRLPALPGAVARLGAVYHVAPAGPGWLLADDLAEFRRGQTVRIARFPLTRRGGVSVADVRFPAGSHVEDMTVDPATGDIAYRVFAGQFGAGRTGTYRIELWSGQPDGRALRMVGSHWYGVEPEPDIELRDLFWRPGSGELFFEYDGGLWAVDARPGGKRGGPARSR